MSILTVIEGVVVAIVTGSMKEDIGWGIAAFIIFMVLYCVPILRETLSIVASLVEAMIVYELANLITSNTIAWFISLAAFFVILGIHVSFEELEDGMGILGYSLVIFEALMIGMALYLECSLTWQAVVVPVILIILSVVPFVRIAEYIILALGTAYVFYTIALESVDNVYAIISSVIIFLFSGGFYIAAYSQMDYKTVFENIIEDRKLKKLEKIYPPIKSSYESSQVPVPVERESESQMFPVKPISEEPAVAKAAPIEEQYSLLNFIDEFSLRKEMIKNDEAERVVYAALESFINEKYLIIPHVGFRELFTWDWQRYYKITDRVTKMHFDFVIYTRNFMPVLVIEVWGKMHEEDTKIIERDTFKQKLLEKCGLNLVKIDVSKSMPNEKIKELTIQSIKDAIPDREKYTVYCPKCEAIMKIKSNKKEGTMFYGCSRFPKCNGSQNISDVPPLYDGIALRVKENKN